MNGRAQFSTMSAISRERVLVVKDEPAGAFNYELPSSIDPSTIKSVLIWCKQFSVVFAIAEFEK